MTHFKSLFWVNLKICTPLLILVALKKRNNRSRNLAKTANSTSRRHCCSAVVSTRRHKTRQTKWKKKITPNDEFKCVIRGDNTRIILTSEIKACIKVHFVSSVRDMYLLKQNWLLRGRPSTVRSPIQDLWFMYQNRLGPSGGIYYPNFVPCFVYHQLN